MRDLLAVARRHRARFGLVRRGVAPVGRVVLLAIRSDTVVVNGGTTSLAVVVHPSLTVRRVERNVGPAAAAAPVAAAVHWAPASGAARAATVEHLTRRLDTLHAVRRLERTTTTQERHVTRTELRIPQLIRVVSHGVPGAARPGSGRQSADLPRPAAHPTAPTTAVPPPAPSLDLGRITDHVLHAMDDRLSAYAERLGRG